MFDDHVVSGPAGGEVVGQADPVPRWYAALAERDDDHQGVVSATAGDSARSPVEAGPGLQGVGLIEGQDDLEPAAVNLCAAVRRKAWVLCTVVPDHVAGSGAQAVQIVCESAEARGLTSWC